MPISLISCIGKLAERVENNRLYWYLEKSKTLNQHQAGFRKGGCTEDQLFKLTQDIQVNFQEGKSTVTIFLDLQQSYDRVWRKGLLKKMTNLRVHGKIYKWIKSFLIDRNIETKISNAFSSREVLEERPPIGGFMSELHSSLFLVFSNGVTVTLKAEKTLYADNLALWQTHTKAAVSVAKLNCDLEKVNNYCQKWKPHYE
ncbi:RNA-directed DNA polymerase from [Elysia marginata]|uniref:RNA-directed DNA polymerase from n=1 Tax=Elysia marginata TaxID=1093978 RepID=A0AAV4J1J1_9GAST|nr:RNA-directed DNA polymerase from [Elysia marginata]